MTDNSFFARALSSGRRAWLLFCLLLLELAFLCLQHSIGGEIRKERAVLSQVSANLASRRNDHAYMSDLLKLFEAEEAALKQKLPRLTGSPALAVSQTLETLDALGIAGEIRKKTLETNRIVLEAECEGTYADLTAFLKSLRESYRAVRLNTLAVEASGEGRLCFTAEVEYALGAISPGVGHEEI